MALTAGIRLGPYEIVATIGAGGMGEVYRARDTRLDRTVAIKVLPASLADDPQFRERFGREARVIAQLDHPHICALYDVGQDDGVDFLVLQYLEGETVEERIAKGPIAVADALTIAVQMADALDKAHRAGVVHRDLKPGNVMLTKSGAKLLDFGLAKTSAPIVAVGATMAPTTPPALTQQGTILGTFQYMAPEQIEGLEADARTDIFAFGSLLFEMVTGRKAFEGRTRASLIGAILKDEPPPVSLVQPLAPASIDRIVATCLAKEPDDRWQTARDLSRELKWAADGTLSEPQRDSVVAQGFGPAKGAVLPWTVAAVAFATAGTVLMLWAPWRKISPPSPLRLSAEAGADASITAPGAPGTSFAISPSGELLAFVAQKRAGDRSQLFVRRLDSLQAIALSGTDDPRNPFFSPDGQWVAFFSGGKLKKIAATGGAAVTVADAPNDRGGAWTEDDTITFASTVNVGLQRVSSAGGKPEPLVPPADGEGTQRYPQVLPGGKAVLFTSALPGANFDDANIVAQPLPGGVRKIVQRGGYYARYVPSGHLVYIRGGTLFAVPFDLDRLEVAGQPVPVVEGVNASTGTGGAQFSVSASGTLVYLPGQSTGNEVPIIWMGRDGKTSPLRSMPQDWSNPRFSPDGSRLAIDISDGSNPDVWVDEWGRDTLTRLTIDRGLDLKPVWTPDGRRIVFSSSRENANQGGAVSLYWQRADGTGDVQRLTESTIGGQVAGSWHPNGKFLAFVEDPARGNADLMILPMEGDEASGWKPGKPTVFLNSPSNELEPMFSPDGRWLAYFSNETGRNEVFVRSFPGPGGKWQISTDGGNYPTWSRTRHELIYQGLNQQLLVASYAVEGDSFRAEKPRPWSSGQFLVRPRQRSFDLHPDGARIAAAVPAAQATSKQDKLVFIFNFADELRRLAPARK